MINGLSDYEKYKVIRPIIGGCEFDDKYHFPIIRKTPVDQIDWNTIKVQGIQNLSVRKNNSNTIALMFLDDKKLLSAWNSPLKKIPLFLTCAAVATPDFSVYSTMNENDIRHNIYKGRWLGRTWQNYGCTVLPTMSWAGEDTFDMCFSAVEYESIVIISTIGCQNHRDVFLTGFNEMKRRINPPLILVFGDMIAGMTGTFINFKYTDSFSTEYTQLRIDCISPIFTLKEAI